MDPMEFKNKIAMCDYGHVIGNGGKKEFVRG